MAATDSYRLAVKETTVTGATPGARRDRAGPRARRAPPDRWRLGPRSRLGTLDNHVIFGVDEVWLTTRRIDGQFPDYKQLIPETFEHEVRLPREELLDVVRRAA